MPNSLPIAVAITIAVVAAWDHARRWLTLAHGRMLSADRSQTFERALTQLQTRLDVLASRVADAGAIDRIDGDIAAHAHALSAMNDWTRKAEATFEKLSADIDTRDRAITNVAEELVVLKQQQTMALAGVANLPKHGFAGRPKT